VRLCAGTFLAAWGEGVGGFDALHDLRLVLAPLGFSAAVAEEAFPELHLCHVVGHVLLEGFFY
jgi:hypothetical protein